MSARFEALLHIGLSDVLLGADLSHHLKDVRGRALDLGSEPDSAFEANGLWQHAARVFFFCFPTFFGNVTGIFPKGRQTLPYTWSQFYGQANSVPFRATLRAEGYLPRNRLLCKCFRLEGYFRTGPLQILEANVGETAGVCLQACSQVGGCRSAILVYVFKRNIISIASKFADVAHACMCASRLLCLSDLNLPSCPCLVSIVVIRRNCKTN